MEQIIGITEVRPNLTKILNEIEKGSEPYIITSRSKPMSVIINFKIYSLIKDYIEDILLLSNPDVVKDIEKSRKDYAEGKFKTFEEFLSKDNE